MELGLCCVVVSTNWSPTKVGDKGCPLGALIFKPVLCTSLVHSVSEDLNKANITLKLTTGWYHERYSKVTVNISEATYVDDQLSIALLHTIHSIWTDTSKRRCTLSRNTLARMLPTSIGRKAKLKRA